MSSKPTRRDALSVAAGVLSAPLRGAAAKKVAVAGHVWVYAAPLPGYDPTPALPQAFEDLKWAGLDAVELMERALRHADAVERIGELSWKHRLPVIGTSYEGPMWNREKHAEIFDDASMVIERVAKLGGRTLGTSVGDAGHKKTAAELDAQGEMIRRLTAGAAQHGVVLNLHNHIYEVRDDEYDLRGTLARVPGAKLGPDLDWLTGTGVDPADFLRRYNRQIVYMHLRDRKLAGTMGSWTGRGVWTEALGEGDIDYAVVRRVLDDIHFDGDAAIELAHPPKFQPTRPLRESWKLSREYVRRVLGF
jgi:sugar phosphate isomerase/epimerase